MIEIYLYGKLRQHAAESRADRESVIRLEAQGEETVGSVLERTGIPAEDVYHVFLNGNILSTRNSMAPWLRYRQVSEESVGGAHRVKELRTRLHDGDRLGLFARDMALLVV